VKKILSKKKIKKKDCWWWLIVKHLREKDQREAGE
jgi:hypothetical protein